MISFCWLVNLFQTEHSRYYFCWSIPEAQVDIKHQFSFSSNKNKTIAWDNPSCPNPQNLSLRKSLLIEIDNLLPETSENSLTQNQAQRETCLGIISGHDLTRHSKKNIQLEKQSWSPHDKVSACLSEQLQVDFNFSQWPNSSHFTIRKLRKISLER